MDKYHRAQTQEIRGYRRFLCRNDNASGSMALFPHCFQKIVSEIFRGGASMEILKLSAIGDQSWFEPGRDLHYGLHPNQ